MDTICWIGPHQGPRPGHTVRPAGGHQRDTDQSCGTARVPTEQFRRR